MDEVAWSHIIQMIHLIVA